VAKKKILVVDDDADFVKFIHWVLEGEGYTVLEARSGRECLLKLARYSADLIVLSTGVDATTVTEAIMFWPEWLPERDMPMIFVSPEPGPPLVSRYPSFARPLDLPCFLEAVRKAVGVEAAPKPVADHKVAVGH
jgi:CheY-like chemotaxis protein